MEPVTTGGEKIAAAWIAAIDTSKFASDMARVMHAINRARWPLEEGYARAVAERAAAHADWYCQLSPWRRWLAMVLGH